MIGKILLIFIFTLASTHAVEEKNIKSVMDIKIKQVIKILKNKSLSQQQKDKKSIKIMDPVFSYPTMAKISLGKKWKTLTNGEKKEFTKVFEHKMKYSYIDKLKLYNDQEIVTDKIKKIKRNRLTLTTRIISNHETFKIVTSFYKKKNSKQWYIYDVNLGGVSIMKTYREHYSEFLETKTFKQLLDSLK